MTDKPLVTLLAFVLGAAAGVGGTLTFSGRSHAMGTPPREIASVVAPVAIPPQGAVPEVPANDTPRADALPPPKTDRTMALDEGGVRRDCTGVTAEVLDPESSSPRFILWADCPGGRMSVLAHPTQLPGKTRAEQVRLQVANGQEWTSEEGTLVVTTFGGVGGVVEGQVDAMMRPRLNRPAVRLAGRFRAERTRDRYRP